MFIFSSAISRANHESGAHQEAEHESLRVGLGRTKSWSKYVRWFGFLIVALLLGIWTVGLFRVAVVPGVFVQQLAAQARHPDGPHNLASYRYGPLLRASSMLIGILPHHHPVFMVDEHSDPTRQEKWCSKASDRKPWVEVQWKTPKKVSRVTLHHARSVESDVPTQEKYRIRCINQDPVTLRPIVTKKSKEKVRVAHNTANIAEHQLECSAAIGIRLDFTRNKGEPHVRLYEVEVWGE